MNWDNANTSALAKAFLALRNEREVKCFLRDLLTEREILEFGNRWKAARMLSQAQPYTRIQAATGLSSTTVARISKWLNAGKGGYRLIIDRLFPNSQPTPHSHSHKHHA